MVDISVIVAVYNVEQYLSDCIKSLVNQNYPDVEFILVDDGSVDESSKLCDEASLIDSRIKVIHKKNGGLSDARNAGLSVASGRYVMFLDGDDVLDKSTISVLSKVAHEVNTDVIQYNYRECESADLTSEARYNGKYDVVTDRHEMYLRLYTLGGAAASGCTKLIKRDVLDSLKFEVGRLHEDEFFTTELLAGVDSVTYITDFKPYQYIIRSGSIITGRFKPKRIYDLCDMYDLRLAKLKQLGLDDLAKLFKDSYINNLYCSYHRARSIGDNKCLQFIIARFKELASSDTINLSREIRLATISPRLLLPLFYLSRRLIRRGL